MAATAKETMAWAAKNVPGFGLSESLILGHWLVALGLDGKISLAGYVSEECGQQSMYPPGVYGSGYTIDEAFESWRHQTEEWLDERLELDRV